MTSTATTTSISTSASGRKSRGTSTVTPVLDEAFPARAVYAATPRRRAAAAFLDLLREASVRIPAVRAALR